MNDPNRSRHALNMLIQHCAEHEPKQYSSYVNTVAREITDLRRKANLHMEANRIFHKENANLLADVESWEAKNEALQKEVERLREALEWASGLPYAGGKALRDIEPVKSALGQQGADEWLTHWSYKPPEGARPGSLVRLECEAPADMYRVDEVNWCPGLRYKWVGIQESDDV